MIELQHLLILTFGVLLGIIIGGIPGLTPTMGVALCIPFTFSLGAAEGLMLLGGIYCGSVYGGSIPAIMFNVPGAPASVATTFDGYPMAKQGKARKALELATISSFIGGLFGMLLLIYLSPLLADFSLQFGPSENFWIAVFGISVIAAISKGPLTKELVGGAVGILISLIGISSFTGLTRFTFGIDSLVGGLHVVSVLIGLFAFPQALRLIEGLQQKSEKMNSYYSKSSIRQSFSDIIKKPKSITIGSIVGGIVGVIPGAGGNIASILAYNEVKRFSKDKEEFGKGNKDGIIASESANNAMVGGSLIPLLTLGIPGSPTAAIFLGGLLIHGIWPGKSLFVENASTAYLFFFGLILAQFLLLLIGLSCIRYFTFLNTIPVYYLAPIIISFCIIGAYAIQNNLTDIYVMVILGVTMFILEKYGFSPAPIALGFILGPIAEVGLLQGYHVGHANGSVLLFFFSGTWNLILIGLILVTIFFSIFQFYKNRPVLAHEKEIPISHSRGFWWILPVLGSIIGYFLISSDSFEQRIFPQIIFCLLFLISIVQFSLQIKGKTNTKTKKSTKIDWSFYIVLLFICLFSFLTNFTGFYIQVLLLMFIVPLYFKFQKRQSIPLYKILILSIAFTLGMFVIFNMILQVPIPSGFPSLLIF